MSESLNQASSEFQFVTSEKPFKKAFLLGIAQITSTLCGTEQMCFEQTFAFWVSPSQSS